MRLSLPNVGKRLRLTDTNVQLFALLSGVFFAFHVVTGVGVYEALLITALVTFHTTAGGLLWIASRRAAHLESIEIVGVGLVLGAILHHVATQAPIIKELAHSGLLVPSLVVALSLVISPLRQSLKVCAIEPPRPSALRIIAGSLAIGTGLLIPFWIRHPLHFDGLFVYTTDIPFHEAWANSLAIWGSQDNSLLVDTPIRYHWFSHGWVGGIKHQLGIEPFVTVTRSLPLFAVVGVSLLAPLWTAKLTTTARFSLLSPALIFLGLHFGSPHDLGMVPTSPSHVIEIPLILATMFVFSTAIRGQIKGPSSALLVGSLGFSTALAKVTSVPILLAGVSFSFLMTGLLTRKTRQLLMPSLSLTAGLLSGLFIAIGGRTGLGVTESANGFTFEPFAVFQYFEYVTVPLSLFSDRTSLYIVIGVAAMLLSVSMSLSGIGVLIVKRKTRLDPETWIGVGAVSAAVVLVLLLNQPGYSQIYFLLSAAIIAAPLSSWGVLELIEDANLKPPDIWLALAVGLVLFLISQLADALNPLDSLKTSISLFALWVGAFLVGITMLKLTDHERQISYTRTFSLMAVSLMSVTIIDSAAIYGRYLGGALAKDSKFDLQSINSWNRHHREALEWVRTKTPQDDIVASNRVCSDIDGIPLDCASRWFLTAAISSRRVLVEGYSYTVGPTAMVAQRVRDTVAFVDHPTVLSHQELWKQDVRWMVVDKNVTTQRSWIPYAEIEFENDDVAILRLIEP